MTNKPLHYELVDLLGDADMPAEVLEAIRVILPLAVQDALGKRKSAELKEIEALTHDLERARARENCYFNALLEITSSRGPEADIAARALYGNAKRERGKASGIETEGHDGETRHGAKHESPVPGRQTPNSGPVTNEYPADAQPYSGEVNRG